MALCGFKTGNATFSEGYNRTWFINFVHTCIHKKIWCGVSSYNSQKKDTGKLYRTETAL